MMNNEWKTVRVVKGDKILVWATTGDKPIERIFVAMLEDQYICREDFVGALLLGWRYAKPVLNEIENNDIFSGENSRELWASINSLDTMSTGDDMRDVLYSLCCALQRLESKLNRSE